MRSGIRIKRAVLALLPAVALTCALPVAAAGAHSRAHAHGRLAANWHRGYWGGNAVVAGTVGTPGSGSFSAEAYVVTPGPGNAGTTPTRTAATILIGSGTKVITYGQTQLTAGDDFYAVYKGVPSSTPLATLESDTPSVIYAYAPPTPQVEVRGVVTTAPASGSDTFVATAYIVTPPRFQPQQGSWSGGGYGRGWGSGYSYGRGIGGGYGFSEQSAYQGGGHGRSAFVRAARSRKANCRPGSTPVNQGTPNTTITTDSSTRITINGQTEPVSSLDKGDTFTAIFDGTPSTPLATVTATPAVSISAFAPPTPNVLYAFVGTVTGTTSSSISVDVTNSIPSGLLSGTDTFSVGPQTIVLGNSSTSPFGSIGSVANDDVVAGGVIAPSGESASAVEDDPLQVLVDFPAASSSASTWSNSTAQVKRAENRALRLLRAEKAKLERHRHRK